MQWHVCKSAGLQVQPASRHEDLSAGGWSDRRHGLSSMHGKRPDHSGVPAFRHMKGMSVRLIPMNMPV